MLLLLTSLGGFMNFRSKEVGERGGKGRWGNVVNKSIKGMRCGIWDNASATTAII